MHGHLACVSVLGSSASWPPSRNLDGGARTLSVDEEELTRRDFGRLHRVVTSASALSVCRRSGSAQAPSLRNLLSLKAGGEVDGLSDGEGGRLLGRR